MIVSFSEIKKSNSCFVKRKLFKYFETETTESQITIAEKKTNGNLQNGVIIHKNLTSIFYQLFSKSSFEKEKVTG